MENKDQLTQAMQRITADPGFFEESGDLSLMEERERSSRLFEGSPLWNDGGNIPTGINEANL